MQRKFLYFINPISGTAFKKRGGLKKLITDATKLKHIPFEIFDTREDGKYFWLKDKIKDEKITDVIVCGGDGTINKIAFALLDTNVNLGIIPQGSGNGLALSIKIPTNTEDALDLIFNGNYKQIDAFYINDEFSCMLCGIGLDAKIAHDFAKQSTRGLATYIKQSIKNFVTTATYNFTIRINNERINTDAFFISIANSNQFGNNFTIAPKASLHDGLLDVVIVQKMNKAKLIWAICSQLKFGKLIEVETAQATQNEILYFQTNELHITNHKNAPLHIDGDPAETSSEFIIKILPNALKLIHP